MSDHEKREHNRQAAAIKPVGPKPANVKAQQTNIPSAQTVNFVSGAAITIKPTTGWQGCILLTPTNSGTLNERQVTLYVDIDFPGGSVTWTPDDDSVNSVILDVPAGFNIGNGDAIAFWVGQYFPEGGNTNPTFGHP